MIKFVLPPLPYAADALEPYIDARTMEIHHDKHHAGYVNNLNAALEKYPEYFTHSLDDLVSNYEKLPEDIRTAVRNNAGGHLNHSMFWLMMKKNENGKPHDKVIAAIRKEFGEFDAFKEKFAGAAKSVFGSGWAWLCVNNEGRLTISTTANQDAPIKQELFPILGLDVWEHAYYLKYQNKRPDYIDAWWHVINWDVVEDNFEMAMK